MLILLRKREFSRLSKHQENSTNNILYLNTIGFKAQSLWGRVQIKLIKANLIKCRFLRRGGNQSIPEKTSQRREENWQIQPTYDTTVGNRTRATLVGGECSHHYATITLPWMLEHIPIDAILPSFLPSFPRGWNCLNLILSEILFSPFSKPLALLSENEQILKFFRS